MRLFGSNATFGDERVDLCETRWVMPVEEDGLEFPQGTRGLLPVLTARRKGGEKEVFAFPLGEGAAASGLLERLEAAVGLVNTMLAQAGELARRRFGQVDGIEIGVPDSGWGFTRVELVPLDAHGKPSDAPMRLTIETCDEPGAPESLTAQIDYAASGEPLRLVLTEYDEYADTCRVSVDINEKTGRLSVRKVEADGEGGARSRLLYKRGHQWEDGPAPRRGPSGRGRDSRERQGDASRDDRRRWDDRRAGRDYSGRW